MSGRRRFMLAGLALAGVAAGARAREARPAALARMQGFVDAGAIAGAVLLVQQRGEIVLHGAVGWRDVALRAPMQTDTIFQVMSQSKPFIAAAVMLLQEQGRLAIDDPLDAYLPEFADTWLLATDNPTARQLRRPGRKITIANVLTHSAGLVDAAPVTRNFAVKMRYSLAEVVALLSQQPLEAEPGTRWRYSNQGIAVAARIVEVVSGQPYEQFVEQQLFAPLEMRESCFRPASALWPRVAACYERPDGVLRAMAAGSPGAGDLRLRIGTRYPLPEAGIFSTAAEMARFHQLMLGRGLWRGRRVLSERSVATMLAPRIAIAAQGRGAGGMQALGWRIQDATGKGALPAGAIHHSGALGSFGWIDSSRDLVGIMLLQCPQANDEREAFVESVGAAYPITGA